ncbi:MAG: L-aspartate oxidase [Desulfitobacteriaceae bacterium]
MDVSRMQTDALVIGGGLAGLSAALELRRNGWDVIIVSKGKIGLSGNTIMTRNSMAAVLEEGPDSGTIMEHVEDTLSGGAYLNDPKLVRQLATKAREGISQLEMWGVPFIREDGHIAVKGSPGHCRRRLVTVDASHLRSTYTAGLALSMPLLERVKESGAKLLDGILITRLLKKNGQVCGACGLDRNRSLAWAFESRVVILAGGGAGQLYPLTTNAGDVSGDSYALAHQAGATVRDMEFIQFHPTVTLGSGKEVLSTAPFSDGAVLRNSLGEAFMIRYSPQGDMATRDVMARAIYEEIKSGRGTERGGVYVDFGMVPQEKMLREYAPINSRLKGARTVEVGTAAHFMMGGIVIDEGGRTGVPGLLACGEVTGGLHGANRLAGNALTEAVVFGIEAGRQAMLNLPTEVGSLGLEELEVAFTEDGIFLKRNLPAEMEIEKDNIGKEHGDLLAIKKELRSLMGLHVGLVRSGQGLSMAKVRLGEFQSYLENYQAQSYTALLAYQQLKLMVKTASLITEAAWLRKESLGAHYRSEE